MIFFFFSSRRRHTRFDCDWSSDVCSSDLLHGSAEGRPLPVVPRDVMMAPFADSGRVEVLDHKVRCSIDALIIAPNAGLMIVGWIDDVLQPLSYVRVVGADWRMVLDTSRLARLRRSDVERVIGGNGLHAFGFFCFLHFDRGGDPPGPINIELWQVGGFSTVLQCTPSIVEDT